MNTQRSKKRARAFGFPPTSLPDPAGDNKTYRLISDLATKLRLSSKITDRRTAGKELLSLLSNVKTKKKLLIESSSDNPRELGAVYRMVVTNALYASESILQKKSTKLMADDVTLPYKLMRHCEGHGSSVFSRKDVLALLNYCLNMLNHDPAKEAAETDLLEMLSFLCSNADYVVS